MTLFCTTNHENPLKSHKRSSHPICTALLVILAFVSPARDDVSAGDIAIIGYQSDDPDKLAFVVLEPVEAGEAIRFTDSGWQAGGSFRAYEGGIEYTAASQLSRGTVVSRSNPFDSGAWSVNNTGVGSGGFALSTAGDQILAFQGDAASPVFVYATHAGAGGWTDATSSNTTALPSGLVDGATAVFIASEGDEVDNGYYNGITEGTATQLRAAIGDPSNWVTGNSVQSWPEWSFTVNTSDLPNVADVWVSAASFDTGDPGVVTVQLNEAPAVGDPAQISVVSGAFFVSPHTIIITNPNTSGTANVTMENNGTWTVEATAVSGCYGSAESDPFTVGQGTNPPEAYAGEDRTVFLSASSVSEVMIGATANDPDGLTGVTYAWTPASGTGIVGWANRSGPVTDPTDPGEAQVTFNQVGIYIFTLTVTDPGLLDDYDTVTITVANAPPLDDYDPPASYYDPARPGGVWYTGSTLKNALHNIIDDHHSRSYDSARNALQLLDEDPNNSAHIRLIYDGQSVLKAWDSGVTWNREHIWPDSLNPAPNDLFNLRACDPSINSSRGNKPFGTDSGYWDADHGENDRGNAARAMFYMDTRYTSNTLVYGMPGNGEMGDLGALLQWHYQDSVSEFERRRNHLMYDQNDNPSYYQGNRNPFIDHPELVWSIWGGGNNDSKLYVGATPPADGVSSVTIDLGAVLKDGPLPSAQNVTLHKSGADPTTFDVMGNGDALSPSIGLRQAFVGGVGSRVISAGLSSPTTTPGQQTGSIVIDNTELTSAGSGYGSADGNDTINIEMDVLEHAEASLDGLVDQNTLTIDFGTVPAASGVHVESFGVANLESVVEFTAGLDLDSVDSGGDIAVLYTDLSVFSNLPAGDVATFTASFDAGVGPGTYQATYTLFVSDEDLPGAMAGANLVLTLIGQVANSPIFPFDDDGDGDVDLADFVGFRSCLTGPGGGAVSPCDNHDSDSDGDVDLDDFAAFQVMVSVP
ncbi:MAG: endonuclease [Phycisphaerae bacterium]|nr:endonuclease [Phycisphaerae bacterium]